MTMTRMRTSSPRLLVTQRAQAIWLERAKVHADHERVIYRTSDDGIQKSYSVPHANLAILFLGQGTSLSQELARLLAEEGVMVAFTGSGGAPLHFGALTSYSGTAHFRRMLSAYIDPVVGLGVAKNMMMRRSETMSGLGCDLTEDLLKVDRTEAITRLTKRFSQDLGKAGDIPTLLGHEGVFAKGLYREFANFAKISDFERKAGAGDKIGRGMDPIRIANACIDHGNYLAYGYAAAALWVSGSRPI